MIKNYTSGKDLKNKAYTFDKITKILVSHKAKSISYDYDDSGQICALTFVIEVSGKPFAVKLPARVENIKRIFNRDGLRYEPDQPYRTAWANIRDWLDAQMALIDAEQAKVEEVFLPYFVYKDGKTLFEHVEAGGFTMLGPGTKPVEGELVE